MASASPSDPAQNALRRWIAAVAPHEWLLLLAGTVLLMRYAWLMDDAFVFFRYADNWVHLGHGLVWNAEEYVEGYSSPAWLLLLSGLRAIGLDFWTAVQTLGLLCWLAFWALTIQLDRDLSPRGVARVNVPLCFLGAAYGVQCYFTSGLETPAVQTLAVAFALTAVRHRSVALQVVIGLAPLVRHELVVPAATLAGYLWWRNRSIPWALAAAGLAGPGGWLVFRIWYYADLFPNTFRLKNGSDWGQGLIYLQETSATYGLWLLAIALALGLMWTARQNGTRALSPRLCMLAMALAVGVFVVKIGGDPRHYRYLAFPVVLLACATAGLVEGAARALPRWGIWHGAVAGSTIAVILALQYPPQLDRHPFGGRETHRTVAKINDASVHRHHADLVQPRWSRGVGFHRADRFATFQRYHTTGPYNRVRAESWCFDSYREFDARHIHSLGLCDPILARVDVPADRPGHKLGLMPLAEDLVDVYRHGDNRARRGMFRAAVDAGVAAPWIAAHLEAIEVIEAKTCNTHEFWANLRLAFTRVPRLDPRANTSPAARPPR